VSVGGKLLHQDDQSRPLKQNKVTQLACSRIGWSAWGRLYLDARIGSWIVSRERPRRPQGRNRNRRFGPCSFVYLFVCLFCLSFLFVFFVCLFVSCFVCVWLIPQIPWERPRPPCVAPRVDGGHDRAFRNDPPAVCTVGCGGVDGARGAEWYLGSAGWACGIGMSVRSGRELGQATAFGGGGHIWRRYIQVKKTLR
jgi:hypothetical protein